MNMTQTFVIVLLGFFCLGTATGYLMIQTTDSSNKVSQLEIYLKDETEARTQVQLTLLNTTEQLNLTSINLTEVSNMYGTLYATYNSTSAQLQRVNGDLAAANIQISRLTSELSSEIANNSILRNQTIPGMYHLHDPNQSEMISFISNDTTDNQTYNVSQNSSYYSKNFKYNAQMKGIRCALVLLYFNETNLSYFMNGFNTTDNGFVFIEPQNDTIQTNISIWKSYWNNTIRDVITIW